MLNAQRSGPPPAALCFHHLYSLAEIKMQLSKFHGNPLGSKRIHTDSHPGLNSSHPRIRTGIYFSNKRDLNLNLHKLNFDKWGWDVLSDEAKIIVKVNKKNIYDRTCRHNDRRSCYLGRKIMWSSWAICCQKTFPTVNTANLILLIYNPPSKVFQVIFRVSSFVFCCNRLFLTVQMTNMRVKCTERHEAGDLFTSTTAPPLQKLYGRSVTMQTKTFFLNKTLQSTKRLISM